MARRRRRPALVSHACVVLALAGVLAACVDPPDPASGPTPAPSVPTTEATGGTLRWALSADPSSLDPRLVATDEDAVVADALFDGLTRLDDELAAAPALATGWTVSDDATSFTFTLDPGARWSDGTPVVADDVVRGLQRVADGSLDPPALHADLLADVEGFAGAREGLPLRGVVALDPATVRVTLTRPFPELPEVLAHPGLAPVPPQAVVDPTAFGESPVGNGPFELAEPWVHSQFLRLVPAPTAATAPQVDELVFRVYAGDRDRSVQFADLQSGQIQVARVPADERATLRAPGADRAVPVLRDRITSTTSLLLFDTRQPPFDDVRFRRGVSLLVDRERLAARTGGARLPATALVPRSLPGSQLGVCPWCRFDTDAAEALIGAALADRPEEEELPPLVLQTSDDPLHTQLADQLSAALRGLGLQVRVVRAPAATYLATRSEEGPAAVRLGWATEVPGLAGWTEELFGPGSLGAQVTGWRPQSLSDLLARAAQSPDREVRARAWQEVERLALDEAVAAPVLFYRDDLAVAPEVSGFDVDPFGRVDLLDVALEPAGTS